MHVPSALVTIARVLGRPWPFDATVVLAAPVLVILAVMAARGETASAPSALLHVAGALCLVARRARPVLTAGLLTAVDTVGIAFALMAPLSLPAVVAYYGLGRYASGRVTLAAGAAVFAVHAAAGEVFLPARAGWVASLFAVAVPVGAGQLVRLRAELAERGRREAAEAAVRAERRRIARELHDVVAHHITGINALVGGARSTLPPGQEAARSALESAERTARQAMAEMRRLLDVLRDDAAEGPDAATGVSAARLPSLVEQARAAGLPARLSVTGEPVELPAAVDHAVYRIVQEALTNTRKHAAGARARVRLAYEPDAVEVEVIDDGPAAGPAPPGFGLAGMAERVALCGGRLATGPRPDGGFRVHARIPLERS
ncbi:sensor histidine kinase [Bailinhaonella thermotolerans]|uniref:histidine kinase n=1 Tax=Bailinhaonella thermotolerans TaxID=1070861 RepID=A0A3A4AZS1_9ACTN|nr:histidine kinase [Bailinhaonella thermotolerans]RJL27138.1 sensor histidine kinase [Bailinhaonella thermotolerans]